MGKWHLGIKEDSRPDQNGFDYFSGGMLRRALIAMMLCCDYRTDRCEKEAPPLEEHDGRWVACWNCGCCNSR